MTQSLKQRLPLTAQQPEIEPRGPALLDDPRLNKGTAFSAAERSKYGLEGLLPTSIENIERQLERVLSHLEAKPTDLERYIYLVGLADRNRTPFYRTLMSDPARFMPIVYDPSVADACLAFGHIYRRPQGMYISRNMKGRIAQVLRNWPTPPTVTPSSPHDGLPSLTIEPANWGFFAPAMYDKAHIQFTAV